MAESADAEASKVFTREGVWVRVPLRARCYLYEMSDWPTPPLRDNCVALFPGQGSITGGAGLAWRDSRHWNLVEQIGDAAGVDVESLLLRATDAEVVRTDRAQLATLALSLVGYRDLLDLGIRPRYMLGHSLGEFSALVAAGLLSVEEGARLIAVRGTAMARAAKQHSGSMVALMGGSDTARSALAHLDGVWLANINGPDQLVVSGTRAGLDNLLAQHKSLGWRRATALAVGGAFHSPLMQPAQAELDEALTSVTWGATDVTLLANVDGGVHVTAQDWRELLSRQLTSPVQFVTAVETLPQSVTITVEMPPAGVLTGLTKRIRSFTSQYAPRTLVDLQELTL